MKRVSSLMYKAMSSYKVLKLEIDAEIKRSRASNGDDILTPEVQRSLRNIRTDLDAFSEVEILCLIKHGYTVAVERLGQAGVLLEPIPRFSWNPLPSKISSAERRLIERQLIEIRKGKDRKLRLWSFGDWASWASLLVIASFIVPLGVCIWNLQEQAGVARKLNEVNQKLTNVAIDYFRRRIRPVELATSAGNVRSTAGTICCVVKPKDGGPQRYILGAYSFMPRGYNLGDSILQPGPLDGGREPTDTIARLARVLPLSRTENNSVTGAIAEVLPNVQISNRIAGFGTLNGVSKDLSLGQEVLIAGRTSGIVRARVVEVVVTATINYPEGPIRFQGLVGLRALTGGGVTEGGDSGAPVVTLDGRLAGMVIAGSAAYSFAVPIERVFDALQMDLEVPVGR